MRGKPDYPDEYGLYDDADIPYDDEGYEVMSEDVLEERILYSPHLFPQEEMTDTALFHGEEESLFRARQTQDFDDRAFWGHEEGY
ncbi:MAG: hypothetical protein IJR58_01255 [Lachnospiraceae bacterium]|nr:hypothetical protein [Lachnospiraceae bacterium]